MLPSWPLIYLTQSGGPSPTHLLSVLHMSPWDSYGFAQIAIWNMGSVEAGLQVLLLTALSLHCCRVHEKSMRAEETVQSVGACHKHEHLSLISSRHSSAHLYPQS